MIKGTHSKTSPGLVTPTGSRLAETKTGEVFHDGVLNHDDGYVGSVERFRWIDGAKEAVRLLIDTGYYVFVVTNQSGVARGYYTENDVLALHDWMQTELALHGAHIDEFRYSPFHPEGTVPEYAKKTTCRKPAPGMLIDLMERWSVVRSESIMIGDQWSDMDAVTTAGVQPLDGGSGALAHTVMEIIPRLNTLSPSISRAEEQAHVLRNSS